MLFFFIVTMGTRTHGIFFFHKNNKNYFFSMILFFFFWKEQGHNHVWNGKSIKKMYCFHSEHYNLYVWYFMVELIFMMENSNLKFTIVTYKCQNIVIKIKENKTKTLSNIRLFSTYFYVLFVFCILFFDLCTVNICK